MPRRWSFQGRTERLLGISQITKSGLAKTVRKLLTKFQEKLSRRALSLTQAGYRKLEKVLAKANASQLLNSSLRICCQYQPKLAFIKVGQRYKLTRKLVVTSAAVLLFLGANASESQAQQHTQNVGNFVLEFYGNGESVAGFSGNHATGTQDWDVNGDYVKAVVQAAQQWNNVITNDPARPVRIAVLFGDFSDDSGYNAFSASKNTVHNGEAVTYTELVWKHDQNSSPPDSAPDMRISVNPDTDWNLDFENRVLRGGSERDFTAVMAHELGHGIGFSATKESAVVDGETVFGGFPSNINSYASFLRNLDSDDNFINPPIPGADQNAAGQLQTVGEIGTVVWSGTHGNNLFGGMIPINTPSTAEGYQPATSLSHPFLPGTVSHHTSNGLLSRTLLPHELGMMRDMGWSVSSSYLNSFDITMYQDDESLTYGGTHTSSVNYGYAGFIYGNDSTLTLSAPSNLTVTGDLSSAIGLFGNNNTVNQNGTLNASGKLSTGYEVMGDGNTINVGTTGIINAAGPQSIAILVRDGVDTNIVHRGTMNIIGANSAGIVVENGSIDTLDLSGLISANGRNAVLIGSDGTLNTFNVLTGATLQGNIVNSSTSDSTMNFGYGHTNGVSTGFGDENFGFNYAGNITALNTEANFVGGLNHASGTQLSGIVNFDNSTVDANGRLTVDGTFTNETSFINYGSTNVRTGGTLEAKTTFDNNEILNNSGLLIANFYLDNNSGELNNAGTIRSEGRVYNYGGASFTNSGLVETNDLFENDGLVVSNSGNIEARNGFENAGEFLANTGTVTVTDGGMFMAVDSLFVNDAGQLDAQNGDIDIFGTLRSKDGTINASGNVIVNNGGVLSGTPTITAQLVDNQTGGKMAAGNSIGTMTIDAEYQTSGNVDFEITSLVLPQDSDLIDVVNNHTATINNMTPDYASRGTFDFDAAAGSYEIARRYTILRTVNDGDLVVVQRPITTDNLPDQRVILRSDKDMSGLYTADARLYYAYIGRDVPYVDIAQTPNQQALAQVLDAVKLFDDGSAAGDEVQWIRDTLDLIVDEADVRAAFDQMSGSFYGSVNPMMVQLIHNNYNRIAAGMRNNSSMCSLESDADPVGLYGTVTGFGIGGNISHNSNGAGYNFGGGGTQAIVAYGEEGIQFGGIYTYTGGSLKGAGRAGIEMHEFGGFLLSKGETDHFLFSATGGYAGYDVTRNISFGNTDIQDAYAQTNSSELNVGLASLYSEYGREYMFDGFALRPFAGLSYVHIGGDQLNEQGGTLALGGQIGSLDSFRSVLGSDLSFCLTNMPGTVVDLRATWMHEFQGNRAGSVTSGFGGIPAGEFTVHGVDMGNDFATLGAGISHKFMGGRARVFGGYDLIFNNNQDLHTGNGGVEFLW